MTIELNTNNLLQFLNENNYQPTLQKETDQVYISMEISKREVPIFFGILSKNTLLQTIAYLPYELQSKTLGEVCRLLHILNRELDMPGFGMDEEQKLIFYRCVVPCVNQQLTPHLLELYLATSRVAVETFMDAIAMVADGMTTVDKILKESSS